MIRTRLLAPWLGILLLLPLPAHAELPPDFADLDPEAQGLAIAEAVDRSDRGWGNASAHMEMVLRNAAGAESRRALRVQTLEVEGDGDKSLTLFDEPADVRGTAFLSFTHAREPDDQWLYLPALRRVKRIASANKSGPFMGSEFAYEDLSSYEVAKYGYRYLEATHVGDRPAWLIERRPAYENSGYSRQRVWIDQGMLQPVKVVYYDRKDSLLKTLVSSDFKQYLSRYWRPHRLQMVNHQSGRETDLVWRDYVFGGDLNERDFEPNALKRLH